MVIGNRAWLPNLVSGNRDNSVLCRPLGQILSEDFLNPDLGVVGKEHQAEYYASEKDVDRDDPDAMRPHKV